MNWRVSDDVLEAVLDFKGPAPFALALDLRDARDRIKELEEASKDLVDKLDEITVHPSHVSVFTVAAVHGVPYTGPSWEKALEALRAALLK